MAELRRKQSWDRTSICKGPTTNDDYISYSYIQCHGFFYVLSSFNLFGRMKETRTTALNVTSQWRHHLNWERVLITVSMFSQGIFKDLSQCSGRGLKSRPPAQHSRSLQSLPGNNWAVYPWQGKKGQFNSPVTAVKRLHSKALFLNIANRQPSQSNFSVTFSFVGLNGM